MFKSEQKRHFLFTFGAVRQKENFRYFLEPAKGGLYPPLNIQGGPDHHHLTPPGLPQNRRSPHMPWGHIAKNETVSH